MGDPQARERILQAAMALLGEGQDPETLTVRQIAERAGAATGAINYHFGTRDTLMNEAVSTLMQQEADRWARPDLPTEASPKDRLKALLRQTTRVGMMAPRLLTLSLRHLLLEGDFGVPLQIVPLLRAHYGERHSEQELRLLALALMTALQSMYLRGQHLEMYAGIDMDDVAQREAGIDLMVDLIIHD